MAGLVPAIHVKQRARKDVDARDKPGHDEWSEARTQTRYGSRLAYGHARLKCDVVVSGGLGCSIMPFRLGVPPEIVEVTLGGEAPALS
jgi:predicted MPP superfamily phosphohydrolase